MQLRLRYVLFLGLSCLAIISCRKDKSFQKELRSFELELREVNGSGFTGRALFTENNDSSFNVMITMNQSVEGNIHPVHLFHGRYDSLGSVAFPLTPVIGTGTMAQAETRDIREISMQDGLIVSLSYDGIRQFNGFIGVNLSETRMDSLISQVQLNQ